MTTTVKYNARASRALAFLKSHSNDVEIFVEDKSSPNLWVKLLRKYLPAGTNLNSVNCLGGRKAVEDACKADQANDGRRRLYIIDSDFDIALGRPKKRLKHLHRLNRYCVENYLLSDKALIDLITSLDPSTTHREAMNLRNFGTWRQDNEHLLRSLFICYAVIYSLDIGIKTVSHSCYLLHSEDETFSLCRSKIKERILSLYREAIKKTSSEIVRDIFEMVKNNVSNKDVFVFVSAKDYIIPSVYESVKRQTSVNAKLETFKTLLAENANPKIDNIFARRLAAL